MPRISISTSLTGPSLGQSWIFIFPNPHSTRGAQSTFSESSVHLIIILQPMKLLTYFITHYTFPFGDQFVLDEENAEILRLSKTAIPPPAIYCRLMINYQ